MIDALQILKQMKLQHQQLLWPTFPAYAIPKPKYNDRTANGLTRCIIDFIFLRGGQAERVSSEGRIIDQRKAVTDYLGNTKVIGSIKRIRASTTTGTADISIVFNGLAIKCEVKVGKDIQSQKQMDYQDQVIKAGGIYIIAKDFESFYNWFTSKFGGHE